MVGRFSALADDYLKCKPVNGLYCRSDFLGRKTRDVDGFDWNAMKMEDLVGDAKYPAP